MMRKTKLKKEVVEISLNDLITALSIQNHECVELSKNFKSIKGLFQNNQFIRAYEKLTTLATKLATVLKAGDILEITPDAILQLQEVFEAVKRLAMIFYQLDGHDPTIKLCKTSIKIAKLFETKIKKFDSDDIIEENAYLIANCYLRLGQLELAEGYFHEAEDRIARFNLEKTERILISRQGVYEGLAAIAIKRKQLTAACYYLEKAETYCKKIISKDPQTFYPTNVLIPQYKELATEYFRNKDYQQALKYYVKATELTRATADRLEEILAKTPELPKGFIRHLEELKANQTNLERFCSKIKQQFFTTLEDYLSALLKNDDISLTLSIKAVCAKSDFSITLICDSVSF